MDIKEAIKKRHSVRSYKDEAIPHDMRAELDALAKECNRESGLNIQVIYDDPECFHSMLAHYGKFKNVNNYIALVGNKSDKHKELAGYYGEAMVLRAQQMGLNTCWVGGTYSKAKCKADVKRGEMIICVIAIGFGAEDGVQHKSKPAEKLCRVKGSDMPDWFEKGLEAAILAPTAMNQQKFTVILSGEEAIIKAKPGPFTKVDLGIVKYHFEVGSGRKCG